jgi:segregation and condensation protein A
VSFEVRLDVFEGPFDLLLALIGERRVDVCDVPIAQLTEDYLASIEQMREMDLEPATEFLVVAATLLQLKARALLPAEPGEDPFGDADIERDALIARLLEVRTFQGAGAHLSGLLAEGDRRVPPKPAPDDPALRSMPTLSDIDAADLARTLVEVIREQTRTVDTSLLVGDEVTSEEAAGVLLERLRLGSMVFADVARGRTLSWAVALFLAVLELAARGEVVLGQSERLGDIRIDLVGGEDA